MRSEKWHSRKRRITECHSALCQMRPENECGSCTALCDRRQHGSRAGRFHASARCNLREAAFQISSSSAPAVREASSNRGRLTGVPRATESQGVPSRTCWIETCSRRRERRCDSHCFRQVQPHRRALLCTQRRQSEPHIERIVGEQVLKEADVVECHGRARQGQQLRRQVNVANHRIDTRHAIVLVETEAAIENGAACRQTPSKLLLAQVFRQRAGRRDL